MIKKLMKYDIKNMIKILIYIYVIAIISAVLTRVVNIWNNIQILNIIGSILAGITYSMVASILINTFLHCYRVFRTSLFKDESYLTHTLPVKKNDILLSKFLSSLVVILISCAVCLLSLVIMLYSGDFVNGIKAFISISFGNLPVLLVISILLLIIVGEIAYITALSFYAVIKGNQQNEGRVKFGLISFFAMYIIFNIISLIVIGLALAIFGKFNELFANVISPSSMLIIMIVGAILYWAFAIILYFMSKFEFKKGVNVD